MVGPRHTPLAEQPPDTRLLVEGQQGLVDSQRSLVESQQRLVEGQQSLSSDIRAFMARLDALIKGRGDGA
jgi:hypothetical protein